jgi:hypothetical protein
VSEYCVLNCKRLFALLAVTTGLFLSAASPATAADSEVIPAAENGCGVDLGLSVARESQARIGYGDATITNLDNGATYVQRSRHVDTETYDPTTGNLYVTIRGKYWLALYPGDAGPSGVVQEPGAELLLSGRLSYTFSTRENLVTAVSIEGTYQDLCELLDA